MPEHELTEKKVEFFEKSFCESCEKAVLHQLGEGGGWTYSAHAMGYSFFSLFSYYLSSPFSIVVLLLMQVFYVNEAVTIVVLMKIGLTGLTMAWYATVSRQGVQTGKERRNCGRFSLLCFIKW